MNARINTLFFYCNDVVPMKEFYSGVLGLDETFYQNNETHGWLTYNVEGVQVVFMRASSPLPVNTEWVKQPGWEGGTIEAPSMVIETSPVDFDAVVQRALSAGVRCYDNKPHGGEGDPKMFFMLDPEGYMVEVYAPGPQG